MVPEVKGLRDLQLCEFRDNNAFIAIEFQDGMDARGLAIRKLFEVIAAAGNISFEEAAELAVEALDELLPIDKKPQDAPAEFKFNLSPGIAVDLHSVKVLERTNRLLKENSNLTFGEAMREARKELGES